MRITYLTHFYPPSPCGGAGYYTVALAEGFRQLGHETRVLCAGQWEEATRHFSGYSEDVHHRVPVRRFHLNWRLAPAPFDYMYDNPALAEPIRAYLSEYQPDIVHITSCYTLSARVIPTIKEAGIPVVVHLVDYWFICARHTLLRKDGRICFGGKDAWDCQRCMLHGAKPDRWTKPLLTDNIRSRVFSSLGRIPVMTRLPGLIGMLGDVPRRRRFTLQALCQADAIIAPSQTLLDLYAQNGVPRHRIQLLHYGHDVEWATHVRRSPSSQLRVGFLGNVIPVKGVHVLIRAFEHLQPTDKVRLDIHGNGTIEPAYADRLRSNLPPNVYWHGTYRREELASILSNIDVIVVPSVWHENHPLVIQEGFAAGCPAIVSDLGGMAEAVRDGENGLTFRVGDSAHLAQQLERLVQEPTLLTQMGANIPTVKTVAAELVDVSKIYADVIKRRSSDSGFSI